MNRIAALLILAACSRTNSHHDQPDGGSADAPVSGDGAADSGVPASGVAINALAPNLVAPDNGCVGVADGASQYCDFVKYVAPHVNGISIFLIWNEIDHGDAPCVEGSSTPCDWQAFDARVADFVSHGLTVNLIVVGVPEGGHGNNGTPSYVFKPSYAASLGAPPQDFSVCGLWPGGANAPVKGSPTLSAVWNSDSCTASVGTCAASTDHSGFPVVYEKPYMTAYQSFVANVIKHYSPAGDGDGPTLAAHVGYARFGMTAGGETQLFCQDMWPGPSGLAADPGGFTKDIFMNDYITPMVATLAGAHPAIGLEINAHNGPPGETDFTLADAEGSAALAVGVGIGMESLSIADPAKLAAGNLCGDDWCGQFDRAPAHVPLVLQTTCPTVTQEYPLMSITGDGHLATATCVGNCTALDSNQSCGGALDLYPGSSGWTEIHGSGAYDGAYAVKVLSPTSFQFTSTITTAVTTGSARTPDFLPATVPFGIAHHASAFEIYLCDLFYAFDPNPVTGSVCSTPPGAYSTQYATTLSTVSGK